MGRRDPSPGFPGSRFRFFQSDWFACLALLLLVAALSMHRVVLVPRITAYRLVPRAVLLDVCVAVAVSLAALLLRRVHWILTGVFLAGVCLLQVVDLEMVIALDTVVSLADLGQGLDAHFLRGSLSRLSAPGYTALTLLSAALCVLALAAGRRRSVFRLRLLLPCLSAAVLGLLILAPRTDRWESSNPLLLTIARSLRFHVPPQDPAGMPAGVADGAPPPAPAGPAGRLAAPAGRRPESRPAILPAAHGPDGRRLLQKAPGAKRNVLLVVLEGIPGVYLRQVQESTGVRYPVMMPALSRIAERSLVVPHFLAHNRQTIRGLYAMLSGDYCKLTLLTPKIYEYMRLPPQSRPPCLPQILAREGYTTAFLQAAGLAYMSKDQFLPQAGFRQVLGRDYFRSQYVPSGWGPDDRAFFEGAAQFIEDLDRRESPWFVTLLTVGTHHPYAVPEEWAKRFPNRKEAAVAYLDAALEAFYTRLERGGILSNTLLVFTSDESHGVTGHPFGSYWGLAVAQAPELAALAGDAAAGAAAGQAAPGSAAPGCGGAGGALLQGGVFGLVDLPHSILDYLELADRSPVPGRRSIFRAPADDRTLLFGPYGYLGAGTVVQARDDGRAEIYRPAGRQAEPAGAGGGLFAPAYSRRTAAGDEGRRIAGRLRRQQALADGSLIPLARQDREIVLLQDREFLLERSAGRLLSNGQYLDFPPGTRVTVDLEAGVRVEAGSPAADSAGGGPAEPDGRGALRLTLQLNREYQPLPIPDIRLPALRDGETLRLSFSFFTETPLNRVWAYLFAQSADNLHPVRIRVDRFALQTRRAGRDTAFRIHHLRVERGAAGPVPQAVEAPLQTPAGAPAPPALSALPAFRPVLLPVAHAGGLYRGLTYTNSLEALEANAGAFSLFEIDFEWTRDGELAGLHDWDTVFRRLFGPAGAAGRAGAAESLPLTLRELRERAAGRGLTPVDLPLLRGFLDRHPGARIITDVKTDNLAALERIAAFFPDFTVRFIPQVYRPEELEKALRLGYRSIIWTLYRYPAEADPAAVLRSLRGWEGRLATRPYAVTLPVAAAESGLAAALAAAGVPVYAHTVNDRGEVERLRRLGVSAVYTDTPGL